MYRILLQHLDEVCIICFMIESFIAESYEVLYADVFY